jgi:hypothetical protein
VGHIEVEAILKAAKPASLLSASGDGNSVATKKTIASKGYRSRGSGIMDSDPSSVAADYPASPATKSFQRTRARIVVTIVEKMKRSLVLTIVIPNMRLINAREKPLRGWRL